MTFQNDEVSGQAEYYPDAYQVELLNMQSMGFSQGFSFGCGFWIAALVVWFTLGLPLMGLVLYLVLQFMNSGPA